MATPDEPFSLASAMLGFCWGALATVFIIAMFTNRHQRREARMRRKTERPDPTMPVAAPPGMKWIVSEAHFESGFELGLYPENTVFKPGDRHPTAPPRSKSDGVFAKGARVPRLPTFSATVNKPKQMRRRSEQIVARWYEDVKRVDYMNRVINDYERKLG